MTDPQSRVLVLQEDAGSYFLVPQPALERWRVAEEHTAEVERFIAEADVSGYQIGQIAVAASFGLRAIAFGAEALSEVLAKVYYEAAYGPNAPV
jgi:hypothetical protein